MVGGWNHVAELESPEAHEGLNDGPFSLRMDP